MLESAYHLFAATRNASFVNFTLTSLDMLKRVHRTRCGLAAIADVMTYRFVPCRTRTHARETDRGLALARVVPPDRACPSSVCVLGLTAPGARARCPRPAAGWTIAWTATC